METRSQSTKFLDLPNEMLAEIFQYSEQKTRLQLRFTCKRFKTIMDHYVGLSVKIEEKSGGQQVGSIGRRKIKKSISAQKFAFHQRICIRQAEILKLQNNNFFLYPLSLRTVEIGPGTLMRVICSTLKNCSYLTSAVILAMYDINLCQGEIKNELIHLRKLRSCYFCACPLGILEFDPFYRFGSLDFNDASVPTKSLIAENFLALMKKIRAPHLEHFKMLSYVTPSCCHLRTVQSLTMFLYLHCESLKVVELKLFYPSDQAVPNNLLGQMRGCVETTGEQLFKERKLRQKTISFINWKPTDVCAMYPFLKAQTGLEKLIVTNSIDYSAGLDWNLYAPIFAKNVHLQFLHLMIECPTPFNFACLENLTGLNHLFLSSNFNDVDTYNLNGINSHKLPANLESLFLINFIVRTEELDQLPMVLNKVKVLGFANVENDWSLPTPKFHTGIQISTIQSWLNVRSLEAIVILGVGFRTQAEKVIQRYIITTMTGQQALSLIIAFQPDQHKYWSKLGINNEELIVFHVAY